ncbi:MAG: polyphosphate polymerase domain-containing protein [Lachnospiraceae bacterium]|nr:polyphosphate polymerase domain-containing protein [Lachnospiraceae bacterium]
MNANRKELKFITGSDVLLDVENRIRGIMTRDEHQTDKSYRIRSVYFDDATRSCYRENRAGVTPRRKYRIRTYNCCDEPILAEIKTNHRGTVSKESTRIDRSAFEALLSGDITQTVDILSALSDERLSAGDQKGAHVLKQYLVKIAADKFSPACIVDYERSAYVYPIANVRITFDRNVTSSKEFLRMFDSTLTGKCALDNNTHILEIKYDEFLPDEIRSLLSGVKLLRTSCSKYTFCMEAQNDF